jgi:hypothetical protein
MDFAENESIADLQRLAYGAVIYARGIARKGREQSHSE